MSRSAIFVRAVKALYLGKTPDAQALARGVVEAVNEVELWQVFGGYSEYLAAPAAKVRLATLVLRGRLEAQEELAEEQRGG